MRTEKINSRRFKLFLEYDGSRYSGWQIQKNARTVQGTLLTAASKMLGGNKVDIQGNGRTDAGVHALFYTAHMEMQTLSKPDDIMRGMNDLLPADIIVLKVEPCSPQFHARHDCIGRSYIYRISRRKTAFAKKYVWWVRDRLNVRVMDEAAQIFVGMHDFISFAEKVESKKSTKVLIASSRVWEEEDLIIYRLTGSHFLWKMIRRIAGVLAEVGRRNLGRKDIESFLSTPSDTPAQFTAPPSGLFFEHAFYDDDEFRKFVADQNIR